MGKFLKFAFVASSVLTILVLIVRSITWRQQYIYEIIDNTRNRLSGAEKEFFKRYTRRLYPSLSYDELKEILAK